MGIESQEQTIHLKRLRPRLSLRTLLLLTTIVALGLALLRLGIEIVPLRTEVHRLRGELGHLVVDAGAKDRIQALALTDHVPMTWKWKVYLPAGRTYYLRTKWDEIPLRGKPDDEFGSRWKLDCEDSREITIVCAIRKSADGKRWKLFQQQKNIGSGSSSIINSVPPKSTEWMENNPGCSIGGVVILNGQVISADPNSITLLRQRMMEKTSATTSTLPQGPAKGLMIWIEAAPSSAATK